MSLTADVIRKRFPGRTELGPDEVAAVLHGRTDRSAVQRIREELERGILVPELRKRGGRWRVPVGYLVAALDGLIDTPLSDRHAPAGRHTSSSPHRCRPRNAGAGFLTRFGLPTHGVKLPAVLSELRELERIDNFATANEETDKLDDANGPVQGKPRQAIRP